MKRPTKPIDLVQLHLPLVTAPSAVPLQSEPDGARQRRARLAAPAKRVVLTCDLQESSLRAKIACGAGSRRRIMGGRDEISACLLRSVRVLDAVERGARAISAVDDRGSHGEVKRPRRRTLCEE